MAATQRMSWLDELIHYYESDKQGHKAYFKKLYNKLSDAEKETVNQFLTARGHNLTTEENKASRNFVFWTNEEWDALTDLVWKARKNNPSRTIVQLCNDVMSSFPEDRRRTIRLTSDIKPLIKKIKIKDEEFSDYTVLQKRLQETEATLEKVPTKKEILDALTDEEVVETFGTRVLHALTPDEILRHYSPEMLLSYVPMPLTLNHLMTSFWESYQQSHVSLLSAIRELIVITKENQQRPVAAQPHRPLTTPRLPKVTVVGLLPNQQTIVENALKNKARLTFVDKNRKADKDAIQDNQDIIVLAANFISHSMYDLAKRKVLGTTTNLITHHGGISNLVQKVEMALEA